ncbi:MAG: hypothetical protein ACR2K1_03375 [Saprospiraceae bacterium]
MIHYHGLPITPTEVLVSAMKGRHVLVSYAHRDQLDLAAQICQSVVLDNGAFSAWKSGKPLDYSGYVAWAEKWIRHPAVDWCLIPDVIDGSEVDNNALVERFPFHSAVSVPVFHMHESLRRLDWLSRRFRRVALGSSGEFATVGNATWWARMHDIMRTVCGGSDTPRVKLHGLRMLNPKVFTKLPLSSADSCNVARNIGIDKAWARAYAPANKTGRAIIIADRIEAHQSAERWSNEIEIG